MAKFDPNDPRTWPKTKVSPSAAVSNTNAQYTPIKQNQSILRRGIELGKDLSGYTAIDDWQNSGSTFNDKTLPAAVAASSYLAGPLLRGAVRAGAAAESIGGATGNALWGRALGNMANMSGGGAVRNVMTPFGPTIGSTRIMTPGQFGSAAKGLKTVAMNTANFADDAARMASLEALQKIASRLGKAGNYGIGPMLRLFSSNG